MAKPIRLKELFDVARNIDGTHCDFLLDDNAAEEKKTDTPDVYARIKLAVAKSGTLDAIPKQRGSTPP